MFFTLFEMANLPPVLDLLFRAIVMVATIASVGFGINPLDNFLESSPINGLTMVTAGIAGYVGYSFLTYGGNDAVAQAAEKVRVNNWNPAVLPGIVAVGTSSAEGFFVYETTMRAFDPAQAETMNAMLAHSIIGSDGFQLGFVLFCCVAVAKSSDLDGRLLRWDMMFLTLMSAFVLQAMITSFSWQIGIVIFVLAMLSFWQFVKDAPKGTFEPEPVSEGFRCSWFNLVSDFGYMVIGTMLLISSILFFGAIIGIPAAALGAVGAILTSAPEMATTLPLLVKGEKDLFFAIVALAGSNAIDTSFLAISMIIRPFDLPLTLINLTPAVVTLALTALVWGLTYQRSIPKWIGYIVVPCYSLTFLAMFLMRG